MKSIGMYLAIFGIATMLLPLIGYQLSLFMWIDNWGPTVGWIIKIAMVVIGGGLFLAGNDDEEAAAQ